MRIAAQPRLTLAASLIALLGMAPAIAIADTYSSASASITNLRYRLIDLDPTDGIAPSATLQGAGLVHVTSSFADGPPDVDINTPLSGLGLPLPIANQSGVGYGAGIAGDTITTMANTAVGNGPVLVNQFPGGSMGTDYDLYVYQELVSRSGEVQLGAPGWVGTDPTFTIELGANTGIVFEGTASTNVLLDLQAYDAFSAGVHAEIGTSALPPINSYGYLAGSASINIELQNTTLGNNGGVTSHATSFSLGSSLSEEVGPGGFASPTSGQSRTQDFLVDYWNLGTTGTTVGFTLSTSSIAVAMMQGTFTVPVPEPGTWALMGLGLAGVALARRRQGA